MTDRLPDLVLVFDCNDGPVVCAKKFHARPPPLLRYCSDQWDLDIVLPYWTFWCWAETNIRPWKNVLKDLKEGNKMIKWKDRVPYAYWRGNPNVCPSRRDLMKCNATDKNDWNTCLYVQDWIHESKQGFKHSKVEDQCTHRYKIYSEGLTKSVSEKYILACDSMTLYIKPRYHDFFIRGMEPLQHYWPIREYSKCTSLKFAVDWGNSHPKEAQAIGEAAGNFVQDDLKMEFVYDYMFYLLNEYAKLLMFKPEIPQAAIELCPEKLACAANGTWRQFMEESLVMSPTETIPCNMPPLFHPTELQEFLETKANKMRQVEVRENERWPHIRKTKYGREGGE